MQVTGTDHCRIINCQNIVNKKPKSEKSKKGKKKKKSSKHDESEEDESEEESDCDQTATKKTEEIRYAEPLSCRKQNIKRHWITHKDQKSLSLALKNEESRSSDGIQINQQLAISHCSSYVPIYNINKELVHLIHLCCKYSLEHGVSPIEDRSIKLDPRSIQTHIGDLCVTFRNELIEITNNLLAEEEAHFSEIREMFSKRVPAVQAGPMEKKMPPKLLLIGMQADHARMQKENFGAIDLSIRQLDLETMTCQTYSFPFEVFKVPDKKGKDFEANIKHLKEFCETYFKNHVTKLSLCGDGQLVTSKFCQQLENDNLLSHLSIVAGKCANHSENIKTRWGIYRILNDLDLKFKRLFPSRTIGPGRKIVFLNAQAEKDFRRDLHYFLELIQCQGNHDDSKNNPIKFGEQLRCIQLELIKNEYQKLTNKEQNQTQVPKLRNPLANHDYEFYRAEFFNDKVKINPRRIYTIKPTADLKQRRIGEQWMALATTANYCQRLVDTGLFKNSFTSDSCYPGETIPRRLSVSFLKKVSEFTAAIKYTKSLADSKEKSENIPFIRLLLISTKIATRYDSVGQKLPLSNEFTW